MKRKSFNGALQALCRAYLGRLRYMARKHGIDVDGLISANKKGECEATLKEVRCFQGVLMMKGLQGRMFRMSSAKAIASVPMMVLLKG